MTSPSRRDFARALATVSSMATLTSFSMASEMGSSESPYSSGLGSLKDRFACGSDRTANRGGQLMDALLEIREAEIVACAMWINWHSTSTSQVTQTSRSI
ncbi:MAG: hypothetical protein U0905_18565 [Pirellulales bacterium]